MPNLEKPLSLNCWLLGILFLITSLLGPFQREKKNAFKKIIILRHIFKTK